MKIDTVGIGSDEVLNLFTVEEIVYFRFEIGGVKLLPVFSSFLWADTRVLRICEWLRVRNACAMHDAEQNENRLLVHRVGCGGKDI